MRVSEFPVVFHFIIYDFDIECHAELKGYLLTDLLTYLL